jgi:hypothetical protein
MVERIGGFILAAIAVEMMATGLRSLFPVLNPAWDLNPAISAASTTPAVNGESP